MVKYGLRGRQGTDSAQEESVLSGSTRHETRMGDESRRSQSQQPGPGASHAPTTAWLYRPCTASRGWQKYVLDHTNRDGLVALSAAIQRKGDTSQEFMLLKFYRFLRDNIPEGLVGPFGHILGNDVMRYLLCHKGESTPSRHKFAKDAMIAFSKLEEWMTKGETWREAQENAVAHEQARLRKPGSGSKKRPNMLAPGLYSPAGVLALLIIAQLDDDKFKNWIVRLQVEWMFTQDRQTLMVQDGFWKGVSASNLYWVFSPEERVADTELLADYTHLFGRAFLQAKQNVREFLPGWAHDAIQLEEDIDDNSASEAADGAIIVSSLPREQGTTASGTVSPHDDSPTSGKGTGKPSTPILTQPSQDEIRALRHYLNPKTSMPSVDTVELARRLSDTYASGPSQSLTAWLTHWTERFDSSRHYQDQLIIQSLFRQSLRRLHGLSKSECSLPYVETYAASQKGEDREGTVSLGEIYMAVDILDGKKLPPLDESQTQDFRAYVRALPVWALDDANARLSRQINGTPGNQRAVDLMKTLSEAQLSALCEASTSDIFGLDFFGILAFQTLRTHTLIQAQEDPINEKVQFLRDQKHILLRPQVLAELQLTDWQCWALLLPGMGSEDVLTSWQDFVFRSKFCPGTRIEQGLAVVDLTQFNAMPVDCDSAIVSHNHAGLQRLFGIVRRPQNLPFIAMLDPDTAPPPSMALIPGPAKPLVAHSKATATPPASTTMRTSPPPATGNITAGMHNGAALPWPNSTPRNAFSPAHASNTPTTSEQTLHRMSGYNAFGPTYSSLKRSSSPLNGRLPKAPKMGIRGDLEELRQDLTEELKSHKQGLREDMRQGLVSFAQPLKSYIADTFKTELGLLRTELTGKSDAAEMQRQLSTLRSTVEEEMEQVRSLHLELTQLKTDLIAKVDAEREALSAGLSKEMAYLQAKLQKPEGYFASVCPAPEGQKQRDYESRLFQACLFYISMWWGGDPSGGSVGRDPAILEETKSVFADLGETAIVGALEHLHQHVFNQPLFEFGGDDAREPRRRCVGGAVQAGATDEEFFSAAMF